MDTGFHGQTLRLAVHGHPQRVFLRHSQLLRLLDPIRHTRTESSNMHSYHGRQTLSAIQNSSIRLWRAWKPTTRCLDKPFLLRVFIEFLVLILICSALSVHTKTALAWMRRRMRRGMRTHADYANTLERRAEEDLGLLQDSSVGT